MRKEYISIDRFVDWFNRESDELDLLRTKQGNESDVSDQEIHLVETLRSLAAFVIAETAVDLQALRMTSDTD